MRRRYSFGFAFFVLSTTLFVATANARSVRLDGGDGRWLEDNGTTDLGFVFNALGVTTNSFSLTSTGSLALSDGGTVVNIYPFFDAGISEPVLIEKTNFDPNLGVVFNEPNIDAGIRITWGEFGDGNYFQLGLWSLEGGTQYGIEFNYDSIEEGDDSSRVGYETSDGIIVDLLNILGLSFADIMGEGDDLPLPQGVDPVCNGTPNALACNNYYDGVYDASNLILPMFNTDYFQSVDTNGDPVQGRVFFLFGANVGVDVAEPSTISLLSAAMLALLLVGRRRRVRCRVN